MERFAAAAAGISGFLGVALGAFGAHALQKGLAEAPDGALRLEWWKTGVQYHLWHSLLLLGVALWLRQGGAPEGPLRIAVGALLGGIALFSGSLYVMTLTNVRVLGAVTPFGGLALLAGWLCVAIAAFKSR